MHFVELQILRTKALAAFVGAVQMEDKGKVDEATILLSQALLADPTNYEPLMVLGGIFLQKGNEELALKLYQKALAVAEANRQISNGERELIRRKVLALQKRASSLTIPHT